MTQFQIQRKVISVVMKCHKLLLAVFLSLGVGTSIAQPAQAQQTPALIAEEDRVVPVSRGSRALAFQITSAILKETRRINVVLPASYSQSSSDRRYPVTILLDVSRRRGH